jgi:hypothetical protein
LRSEEFHNLYFPPDIRIIKPRKIGWVRHVARMEERSAGVENLNEIYIRKTWA